MVGYKAGPWSGGVFKSSLEKPEEAAAEHYQKALEGLKGMTSDPISTAIVTNYPNAWSLLLVGEDGTDPASWKVEVPSSTKKPRKRKA